MAMLQNLPEIVEKHRKKLLGFQSMSYWETGQFQWRVIFQFLVLTFVCPKQ